MIYLRHPVHGTKIATMEAEAIYDEGLGWVRYDPTAPADAKLPAQTNVLTSRRRGRPPATQEPAPHDDGSRTD